MYFIVLNVFQETGEELSGQELNNKLKHKWNKMTLQQRQVNDLQLMVIVVLRDDHLYLASNDIQLMTNCCVSPIFLKFECE